MGNFLAIDQGNSRVKISVWSDSRLISDFAFDKVSMDAVSSLILDYDITEALMINSGEFDAEFFSKVSQSLNGRISCVSAADQNSFNILDSYKGKLGIDRFMAYLGATSVLPHRNILIVDAGSALTIDVVDENGCFRGGNISPGVSMRFSSLHNFTSALPLVSPYGPLDAFGSNTENAIRSGVILGIVAEIYDSFQRCSEKYKISDMIISGGDATLLMPLLKERGIENIIHDSVIVGRGIYAFAYKKYSPLCLN